LAFLDDLSKLPAVMLQLVNLAVEFADRTLFKNLNWQVNAGEKVALVGANGVGKTTLFRVICKQQTPTRGSVVLPRGHRVGYLPQEGLHTEGHSLMDETLSAFDEIRRLEKETEQLHLELETTDHESEAYHDILTRFTDAHHRLQDLDASTIQPRAAAVLTGLGFTPEQFDWPCEKFSGGWQMRIALAKLLLQKPDVLLLDEPTNHLDLESIEWLESYLQNYAGSVIMISHDRYFINALCRRITEMSRETLTDYIGTFEDYETKKLEDAERLLQQYERQQDEIRRVQIFIDRFRYKATKARQVQSRVKFLDRMEKIELPEEERRAVRFEFPDPPPSPRSVVRVEGLAKSYGGKLVFKDVEFSLERGDRVALVGVNGAGKSTLARLLMQTEKPDAGDIFMGNGVKPFYVDQHHADTLEPEHTVLEEAAYDSDHPPGVLRTILGAFSFTGDDAYKKVRWLSGGEKARLSFAKMLLHPANFLIMDEPTNHIDAQTKDVLQGALSEYKGTLLLVSHDRYFVESIVTKVLEIRDGRLRTFLGNYADYRAKKAQENAPVVVTAPVKKEQAPKRESSKRTAAEDRKTARRVAELEKKIEEAESKKNELEITLGDPELYKDAARSMHVQEEYSRVQRGIELLYKEWENLTEK
jgi:ATP-binding cassette subfamily F protein 3